jgi:hypothetical protein
MPVILENGSEDVRTWLDPKRYAWSKELQNLLVPFQGELEVYPVSKDVGKVGNNSPNFIIPVASSENKSNIANFFAKGKLKRNLLFSFLASFGKFCKPRVSHGSWNIGIPLFEPPQKLTLHSVGATKGNVKSTPTKTEASTDGDVKAEVTKQEPGEDRETIDHDGTENNAPLPIPEEESKKGIKRELEDVPDEEPPLKVSKTSTSPAKATPKKPAGRSKSATSNNTASPSKSTGNKGSQKITNFFGK